MHREREAERKPGQWSKVKIWGAISLISLIVITYGTWQYTQPSTREETQLVNPTNSLQTPYDFTVKDINGTQFSLSNFRGRVIVIHIMGVDCYGSFSSINNNQLQQSKAICSSFCEKEPVTFITVAFDICAMGKLDLAKIRTTYNVTWLFINDYDDRIMDITQKYATFGDGTIVLIDKKFHISDSYATITASTLSSKINQLLGA